jgi:membrane-associated protein
VTSIVEKILGLPGGMVLLVAGVVVFAEDALFVGFVIPGETSSPGAAAARCSSAAGWRSSAR